MAYNVINQYQTFRDSTGEVRANGKVTFYDNLTTDLASIWSDEALSVSQSNPYDLDAYGRITGDVKYKGLLTLKIQNADLSDIRTDDNVATLEPDVASTELVYTSDIAADTRTPNAYRVTWYDSNKEIGSGATWIFTGTTTVGNAGLGLHTDGYVYNANGDKYEIEDTKINVLKFGARRDTTEANAVIDIITTYLGSSGEIYFPKGTYDFDSLTLTGVYDLILSGDGTSSILDFNNVTSGDGLKFTDDGIVGGFQRVVLRDIQVTDSNVTSLADNLVVFDGGVTGASPTAVGGFVSLDNVYINEHNNTSGIGLLLRNISHLDMESVWSGFNPGSEYGCVIDNDEDINTGVMSLNGCYFSGSKSGMKISMSSTVLLDSFSINGTFIGNWANAAAREALLLEGTLSSIDFSGNHIESKDQNEVCAVKSTANLYASTFKNNHLSCGTGAGPSGNLQYGFQFASGTIKACGFENNEFLRLKGSSTREVITGCADNGAGLIRVTVTGHNFIDGDVATVYDVLGTTEANGEWVVTSIDANNVDLQSSTFANAYVAGGVATRNCGAYRFENGCILATDEPVTITGAWFNTVNSYTLNIERGGNEDAIWNGLNLNPKELSRWWYTTTTNSFISMTPPAAEGYITIAVNNSTADAGVALFRAEAGGTSTVKIGGGSTFTVATGALTGSTGSAGDLTVSAHTDGKVYVENRTGTGVLLTIEWSGTFSGFNSP